MLLNNASLARKFSIPRGSWTKLSAAMRFRLGSDTPPGTSSKLAFGFCSGDTNTFDPYGHTDGFLGVATQDGASWDSYTGSFRAASVRHTSRVGDTTTEPTNLGVRYFAWPVNVRGVMCVTLEQTAATTFSVGSLLCHYAVPADVSDAEFESVASSGSAVITNHSRSSVQSLSYDESASGTIDHVNIFWAGPDAGLEIEDIKVRVLAP